jgi:endonuclease YncB( thermonuclease family)
MRRVIHLIVTAISLVALVGGATDATPVQRETAGLPRADLVGKQFDARVTRIADGDTVEAIPVGESRPIRIRLEGVDAPEQGEAFDREALALLRTLLLGQRVNVRGRDLDRYGRLVARLLRGDVDASTRLVRAGLACHAYARDEALAREEAAARSAGTGFWAPRARKPACVTSTAFSARRNQNGPPEGARANAPPGPFHGNTSSLVYHASTCPNYRCRNCTQVFASEAAAKAAGFRPANDCLKL